MVDQQRVREAREQIRQAEVILDLAKRELEAALDERLWIEKNEPQAERTVIRFTLRTKDGRDYHYAGIKIANKWYLTGGDFNRQLSWESVWKIINQPQFTLVGGEKGFVVFSAAVNPDENCPDNRFGRQW